MYAPLVLDQPFICKEVKHLLQGMLEKDVDRRLQTIDEVMRHPWFNDVDWNMVLSKSEKPPLIPDINSCYFENDQGEDEEDGVSQATSIYRGGDMLPRTSISRSNNNGGNARRQSYYVHSTVRLPSYIDDRCSFMRSPSQIRQFFDSSTIMTDMNASILQQNNNGNGSGQAHGS